MKKCLIMLALIAACFSNLDCRTRKIHKKDQKNIIESLMVSRNTLVVTAHPDFKKSYLVEDFFVEYDEDIDLEKLDYSLVVMPFIMNIISIIWISGEDYFIDSLDARLYESLKKIKAVFKVLYPQTQWKGNLIPRHLIHNEMPVKHDPEKNVALLFSGGLDSTVSSYYLAPKKQLLITAWGQWDVPISMPMLWNARKEKMRTFARSKGHSNAFMKSNYATFFNWDVLNVKTPEIHHWRMDTIEGIGWAGLTAPILYSKGYTTLYVASSENWDLQYPFVGIPYIDDNIQFAGCTLKHHMFNFSRIEKIVWLAKERKRLHRKSIIIKGCSNRTENNCSECRRCLQTICTLMLIGENYRAYGYNGDPELLVKRIERRVRRNTVEYEDMYNYLCIIKLMKERLAQGAYVPANLLWLLSIDFDLNKARDITNQSKLNWKKLHKMFPEIRAQQGGFTLPPLSRDSISNQEVPSMQKLSI